MTTKPRIIPVGHIFVYGTLRKDSATHMHDFLARHGRHLADAHLQGRLYEVAGYPGAVASENTDDRVYGEVYQLPGDDTDDNNVLALLDDYEECSDQYPAPHEYIRKPLPVTLSNGDTVTAWVYLYNRDVSRLTAIDSGDYLTHSASNKKSKP